MVSTSETGHAKNIDNFRILISSVTQLGAAYNPAQASIQIPALNALLAAAVASSEELAGTRRQFDGATNTRATLFGSVNSKASRILSVMELSGVDAKICADAKASVKKIQGIRASPKPIADAANPQATPQTTISTSQQSYANRLANFALLVGLAEAQPAYSSNEPELQIAGLNAYYSELNLAHNRVIEAESQSQASLTRRDSILYAETTGLVDMALLVKKYVRVLNLTENQVAKTILSLEFRRK